MAKTALAPGAAVGGSKKKNVKEYTGRQKAAIFLVTIGSEISAEIFKFLREDEIETLTFEIARLETIDSEQKDAILQEFQELMMANQFISTGGIDYARELLEKSLGSQESDRYYQPLNVKFAGASFRLHPQNRPCAPFELYSAGTSADNRPYFGVLGTEQGFHYSAKPAA